MSKENLQINQNLSSLLDFHGLSSDSNVYTLQHPNPFHCDVETDKDSPLFNVESDDDNISLSDRLGENKLHMFPMIPIDSSDKYDELNNAIFHWIDNEL